MEQKSHIVVLESDWSSEPAEGRVGPDHTYRDVFAGAASLFNVDVDRAGFASEGGFRALSRRFFSSQASHLIVGGHGQSGRIVLDENSFDPFAALVEEAEVSKSGGKIGLLLASCDLGLAIRRHKATLQAGTFKWIASYRTSSYFLSSVLLELRFWSYYLGGLVYRKTKEGQRNVRLSEPEGDPILAAILTYCDMSTAVGTRFDVRMLRNGELVSSLEVFQTLALRHGILERPLTGVKTHRSSEEAAHTYDKKFERTWRDSWDWEVQT